MAKSNLAKCLPITLAHEGGMSMLRSDPGNWTGGKVGKGTLKGTKYGIAASAYPDLDIKNLTLADVLPIYERKYWDKVRGDDLPIGVDLAVFDYGVNSGPSRAVKELQRVLKISADGIIGQGTLNTVRAADGRAVIKGVCARRLSFLQGLSIWNTFKNGWSRRVADIEAKSVAMWLKASPAPLGVISNQLAAEGSKAEEKSKGQTQKAVGTAGAGTAGGGVSAASDVNWLLVGGIVAAVVIVAIVLIVKARQNKERAEAYKKEAASV